MKKNILFIFLLSLVVVSQNVAQIKDTIPTTTEEEDYSQYENVGFTDASAKRFCSPKIFDISPQRFISIGWDMQLPYKMNVSPLGQYADGEAVTTSETANINYTGGLRLGANIPVVSKNSIVWQMGFNFWDVRYNAKDIVSNANNSKVVQNLNERGLRTFGLNTTVFKPLSEKSFILFQGSADLNGDYKLSEFQNLRYTRYSAAVLWGRRPNDRKQWGIGAARTYRVGEMNYIPIVMFNYTSANRKWGTEILFPARAHYRRTFSPRSLLLAGYELEGGSYRLNHLSNNTRSVELRRGELRARLEYQRQLTGFVWLSAQAGWRYDMSFNADNLDNNGKEFFRGFAGTQKYAMLNNLGNPLYFNIGIHLVSP
jgi:hypothetical protein